MRVLITGAGSGIGAAAANLLSRHYGQNAKLTLVDKDAGGLEAVAEHCAGAHVVAIAGDLTDPTLPANAVEQTVEAFGGLDGVMSNAGVLISSSLLDIGIADYSLNFDLHVRATLLLGQSAYPHLVASSGSIVATGSISAEFPTPPYAMYSASKAALVALIRQMAVEWGPHGIRANCVSPGPTSTRIGGNALDEETKHSVSNLFPTGRMCEPEDIAEAALFLMGPQARQINGVNLVVDGGMTAALLKHANGE